MGAQIWTCSHGSRSLISRIVHGDAEDGVNAVIEISGTAGLPKPEP